MNRRKQGYDGESVALRWYEERGYTLVQRNFTVPGGEIDLILEDSQKIIFVEVKTIHAVDDIYDFVSEKKLQTVRKTIDIYLWKFPSKKDVRCDVAFVKGDSVFEIYKDIS